MAAPRVWLFDFDGTVADTFTHAVHIMRRLAPAYGFRALTDEEIPHARGMGFRELIEYLHIPKHKVPGILARGRRELNTEITTIGLCPGMPAVLRELRARDHQLGIISSNSKVNIHAFLAAHGLDCFAHVSTSSKLLGKAREIRQTMKKHGYKKGHTIYVGDEIRDIDAAHKAEIRCAAVGWGFNNAESLRAAKPDYFAQTAEDLLTIAEKDLVKN